MSRTWFQVCAYVCLLAFALVIADIRKKPGMAPIIAAPWQVLQKLIAVLTMGLFAYVVALQFTAPQFSDWIGLVVSALGTLIAAKGKKDLGGSHAWAGYFRKGTQLVTNGVYSKLRHPIYVGICVFIAGTYITQVRHASMPIVTVHTLFAMYLMGYLFVSARRESRLLAEEFGEAYRRYCSMGAERLAASAARIDYEGAETTS